ncbi:MAG: large-conductance mechanosensitive channel protein MscL [Cytophagales bacterium]|nr:MAG: large-conductance mechanosensitive channel protein MscL [Cytophagales bacterium]
MGLIKEFKEFAMKGNVVDLAVGVIIGGAFGKIVTSMVNDIIMPPIGILLGSVDFKELKIVVQQAKETEIMKGVELVKVKVPEVTVNYGLFIQNIFEFIIIAFCVFMVIKAMNQLSKKQVEDTPPPAPPEPSNEEKLLSEIRDLLKK